MVGNIMVDSLLASLDLARSSPIREELGLEGRFGLVTLHRPALVDDATVLRAVVAALHEIGTRLPLVFPVHPRTRQRLEANDVVVDPRKLRLVDPIGYLAFLRLESEAALVLTDSGGVQEETTVLRVPCLTLRENTERPITITHGTNRLVGLDPARICEGAMLALNGDIPRRRPPLWDGKTSERIVGILRDGIPEMSWVPPDAVGAAIQRTIGGQESE